MDEHWPDFTSEVLKACYYDHQSRHRRFGGLAENKSDKTIGDKIMKTRVITAVVALAIFIPILIAGNIWIQIAASVLAVVAASEVVLMRRTLLVDFGAILTMLGAFIMTLPNDIWQNLDLPTTLQPASLLYIFVILMLLHTVVARNKFNFEDAGVFTLTMMYVGLGFGMMVSAREAGLDTLMYAFLIVWITDSGAYLVGRQIGKHKLTAISPNKTWEGSIGGSVIAVIAAAIYTYYFPQAYGWWIVLWQSVFCFQLLASLVIG